MQTEMDRVDRIIYNDEYRRLMETVRNKETDRIFCRHGLEHCLDVARIAYIMNIEQGYAIDREIIYAAALLHDVVEDTEITFEDLTGEFPEEVVEALRYLTRDKSMNYFDYIRNIRKNPIAKKVKQADLLHNSDVTRLSDCENISVEQISRLHGRYKRALEILHDAR